MEQIKDEILIKALEMRDNGKSLEEVYSAFPADASELKKYFILAEELRKEAMSIVPSRELLSGAIRQAAASVERAPMAKFAMARFFPQMPMAFRLGAPILAVALLVVIANHSQVVAPVGPEPEIVGSAPASDNANSAAAGSANPTAALMAAKSEGTPPQSSSEWADKVATSYTSYAEYENSQMADTSASSQAAQPDDSNQIQGIADSSNVT